MKNISEYFYFLIKEYNLTRIYKLFYTFLYFFVFIRESFFWLIILTTQAKLKDKDKMLKIIFTLFSLLMLASILENIYLKYKVQLKNNLNEVHLKYCFHLITHCKSREVLSLNLVEQFSYIENVKASLDAVVEEKQTIAFLIATSFTVIISARKINVFLVTGLLGFFNYLIYLVQQKNVNTEYELTEMNADLVNKIRNYYVDSKQRIINDSFNLDYCLNLFRNYFDNGLKLVKIDNNVNTYNSIAVILITLIIVFTKYKTSSIFDIFVYLLIVYDLDYFVDSLFNLYKYRKIQTKNIINLENILKNKTIIDKVKSDQNVKSFTINKLFNKVPYVYLSQPVNFFSGDYILCNGKSGEGKTTFFKFLKWIEEPNDLEISINGKKLDSFKNITDKVFLTIQNSKVMYNEELYDYISNHSKNPDIALIKDLLKCVCIDHIYDGSENKEIQIDQLSGGEQMRLTLSQALYTIMVKDYDIILFDEIDVNLDHNTATKIFRNIFDYFQDKIMFFIVHNEELKPLFVKQIIFENHILKPNF